MNEEEAIVLTSKNEIRLYAKNKKDIEKILHINISKSIEYSSKSEGAFLKYVLNSGTTFIEVETKANALENQWVILRSDLEDTEIFITNGL